MSCTTWTPRYTRNIDELESDLLDMAVEAGSEILWAASGRRFGECSVADEEYWGAPSTSGCALVGKSIPIGYVEEEYLHDTCAIRLDRPHPRTISSVKIDDEAIDAAEYALVGSMLIRVGQCWPRRTSTTRTPRIKVSYSYGAPVPRIGELALGQLALDIYDGLDSGECSLPDGIANISRQGVTVNIVDAEQMDGGTTNLEMVQRFLNTVNPNGLDRPSRVINLDGGRVAR